MHLIDKRVGETPLMALGRLRAEAGIPADVPLAYAGRLDPMASGQLIVLEGDECKDQRHYHGLDKRYRVEVLLGAYSDTGDVLGIVSAGTAFSADLAAVRDAASALVGPYSAPYPLYSSRTVQGKPLFQWALEGRADEIDIPAQDGHVRSLDIVSLSRLDTASLREFVTDKLTLVPRTDDSRKALGKDFRVDEARLSWERFLASRAIVHPVLTFVATVGPGTYMRTLADDLARSLGTRGLALSIHRDRIFFENID